MTNLSIPVLTGIIAFIAAIAAPILWVGDIKEVNAVQSNKIETLQQNHTELRNDSRLLGQKIDALLVRQGINPLTIK